MVKLGFKEHLVGDLTLIIENFTSGDGAVLLTSAFGSKGEVEREFEKLERSIARAKAKALKMVTPEETKRRLDKIHRR